jgi:hypothetical protein
MTQATVDVLMITHNRPAYTRLALGRLLETCDSSMRVWIWHNGDDVETLSIVRELSGHPRVHRFHCSEQNRMLREPTNWLWSESDSDFVSKVDDDCLLCDDWAGVLRSAHADVPAFGVIGCWRFPDEDFVPDLASTKIRQFNGGHRLLQNCWIEGSGYLMKRRCIDEQGLLRPGQSFTDYCVRLAGRGWINGWYYPFLRQEHMDDPRSSHSLLRSDADLMRYLPLSARNNGITTVAAWQAQLRRSARRLQEASVDPRCYYGWRSLIRRGRRKIGSLFGAAQW